MWFYVCDRNEQKYVKSMDKEESTNIISNKIENGDKTEIKTFKMANLLDNVENSAWHAFDYLALEGDGTAQKSKLKVSFGYRFLLKLCII